MKKKAIEKIPYMGLSNLCRKKDVKYIGVTSIQKIADEDHLFLEVYENKKEKKQVPKVRIVLAEKDFGTYFTETREWTRGRTIKNEYPHGLIWQQAECWKTDAERKKENILKTKEDQERIEKWCKGVIVYDKTKWWELVSEKQNGIASEERRKQERQRNERRQQALEERMENTEELPEERILEYADAVAFHGKHMLYYKKRGSWATIACSKCGRVTEARWKPGQSYESRFQRQTEEPREGRLGHCPACGELGTYKPQGKVKKINEEVRYLFLGQRYKETGFVVRYVEVAKSWPLEELAGEKEMEMIGSGEKLEAVEIARAYFEDGKKVQKDYRKYDLYRGRRFWDDCNLYGLQNITILSGTIMPETYENMKGTIMQYSAAEEYRKENGADINLVEYLERYREIPQIEMLVKMGLTKTVRGLLRYGGEIVSDPEAKRMDLFLGIRKEKIKFLKKTKGERQILNMLQLEKRMGENWTEDQITKLEELGTTDRNIVMALRFMSAQKLLNRIKKYAGCEYGTQCDQAESRIRHTAQTYFDYLYMRQELGYDMSNTVYLQPKDLFAAHNKMMEERDKAKQEEKKKTVEERFPMIKKNYRKIRSKYFYEDETYLIRPARSAGEIVEEGRELHHCVGGDNYLRKHNTGETYILMLRYRKEEEKPYITVELEPVSLRIIQWYGAHDKKPDEKNMKRWLDAYVTRLKCEPAEAGDEAGQQALQVLAYA